MAAKNSFLAVAAVAALCIPSPGEEVTKSALGNIENTADVVTAVSIPGSRTWYGTCATAQGTQQKTVTTTTGDFVLATGSRIVVKFSNSNTHGSPTLKVDSAAAKALYSRTTYPVSYFWNASEVVCFVYDGTRFVMEVGGTATTTYYGRTKLSNSTTSTDQTLAATPYAVKTVNDSVSSLQSTVGQLSTTVDNKTALTQPSSWTCVPDTYEGNPITIEWQSGMGMWQPFANGSAIGAPLEDAATLTWTAGSYWSGSEDLVATKGSTADYYILGTNDDKPIASYAFVTNALASSGGSDAYHVNSYITELDSSACTFTASAGSYSFANGRLTWLFDGSSSSVQTRPTPGDYTITVTSTNAITDIEGDRHVSNFTVEGTLPLSAPVEIRSRRTSANTWELVAHVAPANDSFAATDGYYAYIDNFQAYTYDKPGYVAYSATNDAAAVVSMVDTIDIRSSTNGESRLVANAEAVRRYTRDQLIETMKAGDFWHYSPDGKVSPDPSKVIIDQEVMFMGRFTYLTSGGMVAISADEGVSQVATTGSVFRIGMFGNRDIEISGDERQLHINSFELDQANNRWVIKVATTFMENPNLSPVIRTVTNLEYMYDGVLLWNTLDITGTKSGDEWTFYVPNEFDDKLRFFSAWAIQGEKKVHIGPKLELGTGQIVINGNVYQPIEITIGSTTLEVLGRIKP